MIYILIVTITALCVYTISPLELDSSNRFQNMLVYINDDVAEGDGTLLSNIKSHLDTASRSLLKATGQMKSGKAGVQFGTVYIRIPITWRAPGEQITWQQCNKADFYVTIHRDNNNRTEPFTKQLGRCGDKGEFTKFSEEFFKTKNQRDLFSGGKKIMTEFVKLRYGVYTEKPASNLLTVFNGIGFINSTCGANIRWTINRPMPMCSDRNKVCKYIIDPDQNHTHSVMFDTDTPASEYFCNEDSHKHNSEAQSVHNLKCNRTSVSSVILKHPDFSANKVSQPFGGVSFVVVKGQYRKIALVIDVSGSMSNIIDNARKGCVEYIRNFVEESASVGLAVFSNSGTIMSNAQIMNPQNKNSLVALVERLSAGGNTNIPAGIAKGIEILGSRIDTDDKIFGTILLLSDGENNVETPYMYEYAIRQVIKKGIQVNAISYGVLADDRLNRITKESGGEYVYADPNKPYPEIVSRFAKRNPCEQVVYQIKLIEDTITMELGGSLTQVNLTTLDKHIGKDVQITVTFNMDIRSYTISVITPSGTMLYHTKSVVQSSGTTLTFFIPGQPEFGLYKLRTESKSLLRYRRSSNTVSITFRVSATPVSKSTRIINPTGQLSSSEIELLTDQSKIRSTIDLTTCTIEDTEDVTVTLLMTTPSGVVQEMSMTDDGLGDDSIEDDKIFTRTLIAKEISAPGFYNFMAHVKILNTDTKEVIKRSVELGSMRVKSVPPVPIQDKVPPAKIEDINVNVTSSEKYLIDIKILATGNDEMMGNISQYEIRITSGNGEVNLKRSKLASPKTKLTFSLDLSTYNVTNPFQVVIRGVDDSSNIGEWSLSKTSNWNYAAIASQYYKIENIGKMASLTTSSMACLVANIGCIMFVMGQ